MYTLLGLYDYLKTHLENNVVHITSEERDRWDSGTGSGAGGLKCVLLISFSENFRGQEFTVTGGDDESYTGVVSDNLDAEVAVDRCSATYVITGVTDEGYSYSTSVTTGEYFGQTHANVESFEAFVTLSGEVGAEVTLSSDRIRTFSGVIGEEGYITVSVPYADIYYGTAALGDETSEGSVTVINNGETYALPLNFISPVLDENSWEKIKQMAASSQGANIWSVGDVKMVQISGTVGALSLNSSYGAFIIGFDHNQDKEGIGIDFQIGKTALSNGVDIAFVDSNYGSNGSSTGFRMNTSNVNSGGWNNSYMRNTICPQFLAALPQECQNAIISCTKYSDNTGGGSNTASYVTATSDKIWLLSEYEVFGARTYSNSAEPNYQQQYSYYANGASKVKYWHSATTTACCWWLRSVNASLTASFCCVSTSGTTDYYSAYYSYGFAPCFRIA